MTQEHKPTILAAGTVPWRYSKKGGIKVLLIRREKQRDWTFPKGKVDKGESVPAAAVRETLEETGLTVALGATLGTISYTVGDRTRKTVQYWATQVRQETVDAWEFTPNSEVRKVKWVEIDRVTETLSYSADQELFEVFKQLVQAGAHETFACVLLRHAKARQRADFKGPDAARPLRNSGVAQASAIVPALAAFAPRALVTSDALRCTQTVEPLADELGITPQVDARISQDVWDSGETRGLRELVAEQISAGRNTLLCSHRPVLPDIAREIAAVGHNRPGRYLREATELPPAAFSVFHIASAPSTQGIVSVEVYPIKA